MCTALTRPPSSHSLASRPSPLALQVFIKDLVGKTSTIDIDDVNTTVEELKLLVQAKTQVPEPQMRLIYAGKQLEVRRKHLCSERIGASDLGSSRGCAQDGRVLRAYRLQRESTIHLVLRLRGD